MLSLLLLCLICYLRIIESIVWVSSNQNSGNSRHVIKKPSSVAFVYESFTRLQKRTLAQKELSIATLWLLPNQALLSSGTKIMKWCGKPWCWIFSAYCNTQGQGSINFFGSTQVTMDKNLVLKVTTQKLKVVKTAKFIMILWLSVHIENLPPTKVYLSQEFQTKLKKTQSILKGQPSNLMDQIVSIIWNYSDLMKWLHDFVFCTYQYNIFIWKSIETKI